MPSRTMLINLYILLLYFLGWEEKQRGFKEMTEKLFYNFPFENKVESKIPLQGNRNIL